MAVHESPGEQEIQSVLLEQAQFNSEEKTAQCHSLRSIFMPSLGLCIQTGATLIFEDTSRIHVNVFWYSVLYLLPFLFRISESFLDSPFFLFLYPVIPLMYLT